MKVDIRFLLTFLYTFAMLFLTIAFLASGMTGFIVVALILSIVTLIGHGIGLIIAVETEESESDFK